MAVLPAPALGYGNPYPTPRRPLLARNVVATSHPLAAQAGLEMIRRGGNAVDAVLAAAMTLPVVEPTGNGLGSDAFAIVWDGKALHGLNGSGRSPAGWTADRFAGRDTMPQRGWDTVTVPGAVSAWAALSERFGRLPFADLCQPAIGYARDGYQVTATIAALWQAGADQLSGMPGFAEAFMPDGRAPRAGELFRSPAMAASLERIAASRGEDFYRGELAERIAAFASRHGGALTGQDLAAHRADWCVPLAKDFYGLTLHELPPNGQGIAALVAAGILAELGIDHLPPDSADSLHLQIEAMKLAFADLYRHVGDPEHMRVAAEELLDPAYLRQRAALVDRNRAQDPGHGRPGGGGTVYLTTADAEGMMVSYIQSNYIGFGSGIVVPGTGISLHSRGSAFDPRPGRPNSVGPGKRPFHTIIPGFVTAGDQAVMSYGVMGAAMQAQGHLQMALRILLHGQDPQTASDAPRWRVTGGFAVAVEAAMPLAVVGELAARGHQISVESDGPGQSFGGAQAILHQPHGYVAGSDYRKDGQAVGF